MMTSGKKGLMSEINVTPFVDVMLVLLIIFMVTAPMMTHGVKVDTPQTSHEKMDVDAKALIISIDGNRQVFVNQYQLDASEVRERLPVILDVRQTREVFLKADKSLPYGLVMDVMAQIREAGIEKIGMVTEPSPVRNVRER
ncbi:MAG: protein TolR [Chlorobium sp.]|jgi:biopolymer transport protein TolR|uniref:protein TolR n=1 Tax=Chlorobium sp. TaxID=1095 RepID=UPI0025BE90E6|nr:protein TolR [Chlorobium sp.]MCF8216944.1 protein TolR [Chlorobium sp.]MCF8271773.1 protein TolR [Chlorobium sp.]MCF8288161.1 protein TolR [Chlorobium sp.]MCF8291752.1 protein TolR [Chlorobium sp.]MCF8385844.1 protein TolR [Chlorobium sp.]